MKLKFLNVLYLISAILSSIVGLFILTYIIPSADFLPLMIVFFPLLIILLIAIGLPSFFLIKKYIKKKTYLLIYLSILIILIIFYIFILSYKIGPVEDDAFLKIICKLKPAHEIRVTNTSYPCDESQWWYKAMLKKWKGYHGCNESTKGYYVYNNKGYLHNLECCVEKNPFQM